ncbi:MAC/Perforin [Gracilaria domingensis]|nr:MAC/Perforin [Gracilaria domingensis]
MSLLRSRVVLFFVSICLCGSRSEAFDTWDTLGFGFLPYDGTFDFSRVQSRVLDLGSLVERNGRQVRQKTTLHDLDNVQREKRVAEGFNEFSRSLKRDISAGGGFAGFKASVAMHYRFDTTQRTDYFFSRVAAIAERGHLRVQDSSVPALTQLVLPNVASYLASATPQQIFSIYGTHVTTGMVFGGMLELWSSSMKSRFSSESEYTIAADASFKKFVKGSFSLTREERLLVERMESVEGLVVKGGEFNVGENAESNWVQSTTSNSQAIKFLSRGAVPIWDLIPNAAQSRRVKEYYEQIFGARPMILKRFQSTALNLLDRVPHPEAEIYVPKGWKVISGGADVEFYGVGQLLTKSYPLVENGTPVGWFAQSKDHLKSDEGKIQAFAIGLWDPFDTWEVIVHQRTSSSRAHPRATAFLPSFSGYMVTGGGANNLWQEPGSLLVTSAPTSGRSLGWVASAKDHLRSAPGSVTAYVIGMRLAEDPYRRITTRDRSSRFGPANHPSGTIYATQGFSFVGGGAEVSRGGVGNMLVDLIPSADGKTFSAYAKDHLEVDRQYITVHGIEVEGALYIDDIEEVFGIDPTAF